MRGSLTVALDIDEASSLDEAATLLAEDKLPGEITDIGDGRTAERLKVEPVNLPYLRTRILQHAPVPWKPALPDHC